MYNIKKSLKYNCFSVCIEINLVKPFTFFFATAERKKISCFARRDKSRKGE